MISTGNENPTERFRRRKRREQRENPPFLGRPTEAAFITQWWAMVTAKGNWPINISINNVQRLTSLGTTIERQRQGRSGILVDKETELRGRKRRADKVVNSNAKFDILWCYIYLISSLARSLTHCLVYL
jgi:hypothetical protein